MDYLTDTNTSRLVPLKNTRCQKRTPYFILVQLNDFTFPSFLILHLYCKMMFYNTFVAFPMFRNCSIAEYIHMIFLACVQN